MLPSGWQDMFFQTLRRTVDPTMTYTTQLSVGQWAGTGVWGNVLGRGVRVSWKDDQSGRITLAPGPLSSFEQEIPGSEDIAISPNDDWETVAADVQRRLTAGG
jgi:hypothetical protein